MSNIYKAQPDRDLQCYFQAQDSYPYMYGAPTGISAIVEATSTSLTLQGEAHDQFDWSLIEWNRDNIFEHIDRRNIPNGDWTGLTLTYRDNRTGNVIPFDSFLYDWQDWSHLRIFTDQNSEPYLVTLKNYATAGPGAVKASATFTLSGSRAAGGSVNLTCMGENYWAQAFANSGSYSYFFNTGETYPVTRSISINGVSYSGTANVDSHGIGQPMSVAVTAMANAINADSGCPFSAGASGNTLTLNAKGTMTGSYSINGVQTLSGCGNYDYTDIYAALATASGAASSFWFNLTSSSSGVVVTAKNAGTCYNRLCIFATTNCAMSWNAYTTYMSGGIDPSYWTITLPFNSLMGTIGLGSTTLVSVPVTNIRAMRWTFTPDQQHTADTFPRQTGYQVKWTNWVVSGGANAAYTYAGKNSLFIRCDDPSVTYSGTWDAVQQGNYTGGRIRATASSGAHATMTYRLANAHSLYLGSRLLGSGGKVTVTVDGTTSRTFDLWLPSGAVGEDRLCRLYVGDLAAGTHTVVVQCLGSHNAGSSGYNVYFNYIQAAVITSLPRETYNEDYSDITLATDWDTEHCLAHSPNRIVDSLDEMGFFGRTNHYVGALKWYNLQPTGGAMASVYVDFTETATPTLGSTVSVTVNGFAFQRTILNGETLTNILDSMSGMINNGSVSVSATNTGTRLTLTGRNKSGGVNDPNTFSISATSSSDSNITVAASGSTFSGGTKWYWVTDKSASTALNLTTTVWLQKYCAYLKLKGRSAIMAFSQELGHEPKTSSLAALTNAGTPQYLNTPSLMCNFSTEVSDFFKRAYLEIAQIMYAAELEPYIQFGEVQWWYFPTYWDISQPLTSNGDYWQTSDSMAFYDAYTKAQFTARYGGTMHTFVDGVDGTTGATVASITAAHPHECELIPTLIGEYTNRIIAYVTATVATCKFQVLYSLEVNTSPVAAIANQPSNTYWGSAVMDSFKAEGFGVLAANDFTQTQAIVQYPYTVRNFTRRKSHCLVGCNDPDDPFVDCMSYAVSQGTGDKVLWAFDQFCFRSHKLPLFAYDRSGVFTSWHFASLGQ